MFYRIIRVLKEHPLVSQIEVLDLVEEETVSILKLKATLVDDSVLYLTEVHTSEDQKYSYHWQDSQKRLRIRWDNSPHWSHLETFPHHKHLGERVVSSPRPSIEEVLTEIEKVLKRG